MKLRKNKKLRATVSSPKRKTLMATGAKKSPHKKGLPPRDVIEKASLNIWDPYEAGRQAVDALTRAEGGSVTRQEAAKKLGIKLATLYSRIRDKEVVVWTDTSGNFQFPLWQFGDNELLPGIAKCLKILDSFDYWAVMRFFLTRSEAYGASPLTLLRKGNVEAAKSIAANASVHGGG